MIISHLYNVKNCVYLKYVIVSLIYAQYVNDINISILFPVWTPAVLPGTRWDHAWDPSSAFSLYSGACADWDGSWDRQC